MPQPRPWSLRQVGDVAAQFGHQAGDDDRVAVVGLVAGVVLGLAGTRHQHGLHAHHRQPAAPGRLQHDLPPVPGWLTGHHHPGEPGAGSDRRRPAQDRLNPLRWPAELPPPQHPRVMVGHHRSLLAGGQIHRDDRQILAHLLAQ